MIPITKSLNMHPRSTPNHDLLVDYEHNTEQRCRCFIHRDRHA